MHTSEFPATPNITLSTNSRRTILLLRFCPYSERNASQFFAAGHASVRATDWQIPEQSAALCHCAHGNDQRHACVPQQDRQNKPQT